MIKITSRKDIDSYYASSALSQSEFKLLLYGVKNYREKRKFNGTSDAMKIGSAVDMILTGNEGEFETSFYTSQLSNLPAEKVVDIVRMVRSSALIRFQNFNGELDDESIANLKALDFEKDLDEEIINAINACGYYTNRKIETNLKNVKEIGAIYFYDLINSIGKSVLSQEERATIDAVVKALRENTATSKYFNREKQDKFTKVMFHYQYPIYFEYSGLSCKCLLDLVVFVMNEKGEILTIEPIDLKTTYEDTTRFSFAARKMRYDIQAAWYTLGINKAFNKDIFPNTVIKNFKFIVESTTSPGTPLVYIATDNFLKIGKEGRNAVHFFNQDSAIDFSKPDGNTVQDSITLKNSVKGYEDLVKDYIYYSMNGFDQEREVVEGKGVLNLDFD